MIQPCTTVVKGHWSCRPHANRHPRLGGAIPIGAVDGIVQVHGGLTNRWLQRRGAFYVNLPFLSNSDHERESRRNNVYSFVGNLLILRRTDFIAETQLPSKAPYSKRFEEAVGQACESAAARQVARHMGLAASTVRAIDLFRALGREATPATPTTDGSGRNPPWQEGQVSDGSVQSGDGGATVVWQG